MLKVNLMVRAFLYDLANWITAAPDQLWFCAQFHKLSNYVYYNKLHLNGNYEMPWFSSFHVLRERLIVKFRYFNLISGRRHSVQDDLDEDEEFLVIHQDFENTMEEVGNSVWLGFSLDCMHSIIAFLLQSCFFYRWRWWQWWICNRFSRRILTSSSIYDKIFQATISLEGYGTLEGVWN